MAKVQATYPTLNDIPEALRDFYEEKDGTYVISAEGAVLEADHMNLRKALEAERKSNADAKRAIKPWSELAAELGEDLSPEKVREIHTAYKKLQADLEAVTKDERRAIDLAVHERVQALEQKFAGERARIEAVHKAEKDRADKFEGIYRAQQFRDKMSKAFGDLVHESAIRDLVSRAKDFGWKLNGDDELVVQTPKGDPVYSGRDPRQPMTPEEWVQDIASKEAPHAFKSSSGTGDRSRPGVPTKRRRSEMTAEDKSNFVETYGLEAFQQLPK